MANRFIPYVPPKPTNKNYGNKPLCKNLPKELSTIHVSQRIERNLSPIALSIVDSDLPTQKANGDNGITAERSLMEICRSGGNGSEDVDNNYFPTIPELVSFTFRKDKPAEQGLAAGLTSQVVFKPTEPGLSKGRVIEAIGKPVLDEGSYSSGPSKLVPGLHPGESQDEPIIVGEDELDDTRSETGVSDSNVDSTKVDTSLDSRQTSIDITTSSSLIPQSPDAHSKVSRVARLDGTASMPKTAGLKRVQCPLKRKIRHTPEQSLSDIYEIQDSSTESDIESEFDERLIPKKQKVDDLFLDYPKSRLKKVRTEQDELPAAHDAGQEGTKDCGDTYDEAIGLTTTSDGELDHQDSADIVVKEGSDMPQSRRNDSSHLTPAAAVTALQELATAVDDQPAALARSASVKSDDPGKPQPVVDDEREWEIRDIIGKEVVDGEVHYLVEWSATLVPKYELRTAKALVEKFEARLRAQCKQSDGKRRGRLPLSKAGKQAAAEARTVGETQQKKRRGRPRKQV